MAAVAMSLGCLGSAQASTTTINFDPGANWRTTTDRLQGQQWALGNFDSSQGIAVQTGYGNSATTSLPVDSMMWNCGPDGDLCRDGFGQITGGSGPLEAFFAYGFQLDEGARVLSAVLSLVADDFFHLRINGVPVVAAMLTDHMNAMGQPEPMRVDIASYLRTGANVLSVRAMDGSLKGTATTCARGIEVTSVLGPFCQYDRGNEYLSVGGGAIVTVPAPSSLWLLGGSLGLLAALSGRRRRHLATTSQPA
jgi:hypothetical protein